MGRMFGILMIVAGVWIGMEFYNEGIDNAFGGIFAGAADPIHAQYENGYDDGPTRHEGSIAQRVRAAVTSDLETGAARREEGMGRD